MFLKHFSAYGTSCCSRIRVRLDGVVKEQQFAKIGTYQKASGLIFNKFHWTMIGGNSKCDCGGNLSIWYNNVRNIWSIGPSNSLGSDIRGLGTIREAECPTSTNRYKYYNGKDASRKWCRALALSTH